MAPALVMALNNVLLPTFGKPTIPTSKFVLIYLFHLTCKLYFIAFLIVEYLLVFFNCNDCTKNFSVRIFCSRLSTYYIYSMYNDHHPKILVHFLTSIPFISFFETLLAYAAKILFLAERYQASP
ncbi:hypothetical protein SBF1_7010007 [Candidatus Desulfosporosinus infrequens]|uniref:Uncharacterized protein n=1 Tax=Candidatus Desulfosporosinus infrequens TaxID=2043169 RepID=A0A2U3LPH5_9FIRM|nr:hypothetical protein SBF1_7010007 [Candidatus Desulfosporosinus infrequens]